MRVNFALHIGQVFSLAVGHDQVGALFEGGKVVDHSRVVKVRLMQYGLIHNHLHPFGLEALQNIERHKTFACAVGRRIVVMIANARVHHAHNINDLTRIQADSRGVAELSEVASFAPQGRQGCGPYAVTQWHCFIAVIKHHAHLETIPRQANQFSKAPQVSLFDSC